MGAWGATALQSDAALDWIGNFVTDPLVEQIERAITEYDKDGPDVRDGELRAAGFTLAAISRWGAYNEKFAALMPAVIDRLTALRDNEDWLNNWADPIEVRDAMQTEIDQLREQLASWTKPDPVEPEAKL